SLSLRRGVRRLAHSTWVAGWPCSPWVDPSRSAAIAAQHACSLSLRCGVRRLAHSTWVAGRPCSPWVDPSRSAAIAAQPRDRGGDDDGHDALIGGSRSMNLLPDDQYRREEGGFGARRARITVAASMIRRWHTGS